jgi:hypothetical protein
MTDNLDQKVLHFRVKLGELWIHAIGIGEPLAVRKRLEDDDPIWQRPSVELVDCRRLGDSMGPFPAGDRIKFRAVEADD